MAPAISLVGSACIFLAVFFALDFHTKAADDRKPEYLVWGSAVVMFSLSIALGGIMAFAASWNLNSGRRHKIAALSAVGIGAILSVVITSFWAGPAAGWGGKIAMLGDQAAARVTTFNTVMVWTAVVLAVIACTAILARSSDASISGWSANLRWFRLVLATASFMLVCSVMHTAVLYDLGAVLRSTSDEDLPELRGYARAVTTASGLLFAGIHVAAFLPTALVMDRRYHHVKSQAIAQAPESIDLEVWAVRNDFPPGPLSMLSTYVALAAPLVAALAKSI
jgi:hypothetical protein